MNLPVNSRLLCQLSYAGLTRIRLAHPGRACDTSGDAGGQSSPEPYPTSTIA